MEDGGEGLLGGKGNKQRVIVEVLSDDVRLCS